MGCSSWVPWVMHACPRTPWAKGEGTFYLFAGLGAATPRITDPALSWPGIGGRVCVYVVVWTGPPPPPPSPGCPLQLSPHLRQSRQGSTFTPVHEVLLCTPQSLHTCARTPARPLARLAAGATAAAHLEQCPRRAAQLNATWNALRAGAPHHHKVLPWAITQGKVGTLLSRVLTTCTTTTRPPPSASRCALRQRQQPNASLHPLHCRRFHGSGDPPHYPIIPSGCLAIHHPPSFLSLLHLFFSPFPPTPPPASKRSPTTAVASPRPQFLTFLYLAILPHPARIPRDRNPGGNFARRRR